MQANEPRITSVNQFASKLIDEHHPESELILSKRKVQLLTLYILIHALYHCNDGKLMVTCFHQFNGFFELPKITFMIVLIVIYAACIASQIFCLLLYFAVSK